MHNILAMMDGFPYYPYHELAFLNQERLKQRFTHSVRQELESGVPFVHLAEKGTDALVAAPKNDWDSRHFGINIVDLQAISVTKTGGAEGDKQRADLLTRSLFQLEESLAERGVWDAAYLRVDSRDYAAIWAAEQNGFRMYAGNVTFGLDLLKRPPQPCAIDRAHSDDLESLRRITRAAFGGNELTRTRYYADPHFCRSKVEELYDFWLCNSLAGQLADDVLVTRNEHGEVLGYATLRWRRLVDLHLAEVGLIAVDPSSQGQGLAGKLLDASAAIASESGDQCLLLGTQLDNYAIQKAMMYRGFVPYYTKFVYHRWSPA